MSDDLYERTVLPAVLTVLDGTNCVIFVFGNGESGRSYTLEKDDGIVHRGIQGLYDSFAEKLDGVMKRRRQMNLTSVVSAQFVQIVDERAVDLLRPEEGDLDTGDAVSVGIPVNRLSRSIAANSQQMKQIYQRGLTAKTSTQSEFGPLSRKATTIFSLELHQVEEENGRSNHTISRLFFVELPAADILSKDTATIRIREGNTLNHGIFTFAKIINEMAKQDTDFVDYDASKTTQIMSDMICGSCLMVFLVTIRVGDYFGSSFVLEYAELFTRLIGFPILNDGKIILLNRKRDKRLIALKQQLLLAQTSQNAEEYTSLLLQLHQLEAKMLEKDEEKIRHLSEREQLIDKMTKLRTKYNEIVNQKMELQARLIASEEERIKVSKALVDLQMENTNVLEDSETSKFDIMNRLLVAENESLQLDVERKEKAKKIQNLEEQITALNAELNDYRVEILSLNENLNITQQNLEKETQKSQELSVELINTINYRDQSIQKLSATELETRQLYSANEDLEDAIGKLEAKVKEYEEKIQKMGLENEQLLIDAAKKELEKEGKIVELERAMTKTQKSIVDHQMATTEELLMLKTEREEMRHTVFDLKEKHQSEILEITAKFKQTSRRCAELETTIRQVSENNAALSAANSDLQDRLTTLNDQFRDKLQKYIGDIGDMYSKSSIQDSDISLKIGQSIDALFNELISTYKTTEESSKSESFRLRSQNHSLQSRCRRLYQAYRSLRYQLEDLAPPGAAIDIFDDSSLTVSDLSDIEMEQQTALAAANDRIQTLERELNKSISSAATTAENQLLKLSESNNQTIKWRKKAEEFEESLRILESRKMQQDSEMKNLQAELLSQLNDLKTRGLPVAANSSSISNEKSEETERLRQQLSSAKQRIADLEQEVQNLRTKISSTSSASAPEVANLRSQVDNLQNELRQAKSALATASTKTASDSGGNSEEVKQLKAKVLQLENIIQADDLKQVMKEFTETTQQELEGERADLRSKLAAAEAALEDANKEISRLKAR